MKKIQLFLLRHARLILSAGVIVLIAGGVYGLGLFSSLNDGDDNFFATTTASAEANRKVKDIFGSADTETSVVLLEAKNRSADVKMSPYGSEATRLLNELNPKTAVSYYTTELGQFVSLEGNDTYAAITLSGTDQEQYNKLMQFAETAKSDLFKVSVGGLLVGQHQTQAQAKDDLTKAELISLPILALLLLWFFRGPVAASIPLAMSALTIAGALAVARLIGYFVAIDTYSLNVITILGIGLSVDYSLLAVNRFREELAKGKQPNEAALATMATAGRTIVFSGATVVICLLTLLLFPVGFMHSVSIGGAAAVLVAVAISALLLPLALRLLGSNLNKWSLKRRISGKGWQKVAETVTNRPVSALMVGIVLIVVMIWPVHSFQTKAFDWHVLPSNQSAYYVGKIMDERFEDTSPSLRVMAEFPDRPTPQQLCQLAQDVSSIDGVKNVQAAYAPTEQLPNCSTLPHVLSLMPVEAAQLRTVAGEFTKDRYALVDIVSKYDSNDSRNRDTIKALRSKDYGSSVTISVTGVAAQSHETLDTYLGWMPAVIGIIAVAMIVLLSLLLGSVVLPLQAVVINSLALFISLGVLVAVFQYGWGADLLHLTASGGFELSIPILIFVIAFGLSMDYAVFLYSRMHEEFDKTGDHSKAIIQGVVKTGPVITAAALLLFVVVAAFATSRISLIQQIGVGLAVAVLVDAFFVRTIFVPAMMKLFGRASWWGPKWLKKITIKHD